jgi:hypothetical protein
MTIDLRLINSIQFGFDEEQTTESLKLIEKLNKVIDTRDQSKCKYKTIDPSKLKFHLQKMKCCYSGSQNEIDSSSMRPINFTGPLEHVLLPDSLDRRIMQVAFILLTNKEFYDFITEIPDVHIVKKFNPFDQTVFPETSSPKDCIDETFKEESLYACACQSYKQFVAMRKRSLQVSNPIEWFKEMGYKQVQSPSIGDVIVYFANTIDNPRNQDPKVKHHREKNYVDHYGRVCEIRKNGTIIVQSKFGTDAGTYQHRLDLLPCHYGNSYLVYSKK